MNEINPVQTQAPAIAPVTREETESFFQRLATNFVRMSAQDQEIRNMREEVGLLSQRLTRFLDENDKLKNEVTTAYELMKSIEQERDNAKRDLVEATHSVDNLHNQLNSQGQELQSALDANAELKRQVQALQAKVSQSNQERDAFRDNRDYWQKRAADFEDTLHHTEQDLSGWQERTLRTELERDKFKTRLNQMKSILSPPEEQPQAQQAEVLF